MNSRTTLYLNNFPPNILINQKILYLYKLYKMMLFSFYLLKLQQRYYNCFSSYVKKYMVLVVVLLFCNIVKGQAKQICIVLFSDSSNYNFYECCHLGAQLPDDSYRYRYIVIFSEQDGCTICIRNMGIFLLVP